MLNAYGAKLEEVPLSLADSAGSMQKARMAHAKKLADKTPNSFYPCQHLNPDNPLAHYYYTAFEIANAFPNQPDAIVIRHLQNTTGNTIFNREGTLAQVCFTGRYWI